MVTKAVLAALVAFAVAAILTPLAARFARRIGAIDAQKDIGLAKDATPLLGGLAIFGGALVAGLLFLPDNDRTEGILAAAALITIVGALDDRFDLPPVVKFAGQIAAAVVLVASGVVVDAFTFPFLHRVELGDFGGPLSVFALVLLMNIVNFSDGADGLAAGVCAIAALAFAVIAFDLERRTAGTLAAITAGAALGFLLWNFPPAKIFMGDCGSNLLGLLLGAVIIEGTLKTNALIALVGPLVVLAVPLLDTGFVVLKRLKYRRPIYRGDSNHFHHRFYRMKWSTRRSILWLYAWTSLMAGTAVALRFIPYSERDGTLTGWALLMAALLLLCVAVSLYLIWVLEIIKLRRLREWQLRRSDPDTSEHDIDEAVDHELETGEFGQVRT
ncbi:undecaprenyl/decaprenyl-phosphate alpha-N-acetylglucosaminyl 1-phosphate transferase [Solirubrobacter phytolaccae]|uniref:Undecaprenyl/decaprenyl-phosphate alpha-N-acetylglucosaminyl 1-phosphate transferase n=1 Tax=Solirubrobacter phytolaccae TaxID=1404360 RepID=A0A9X3N826_9ACTN|nr:MraY family glycosyltransferase [Solirubrobacter phytolaccae]MDA0181493.1 undecaprenyl/decaprenyl-phosphate alpha-N-acetylglucosaminyl 1-phosphate transferase [Solirubrobacter phytolaccae]